MMILLELTVMGGGVNPTKIGVSRNPKLIMEFIKEQREMLAKRIADTDDELKEYEISSTSVRAALLDVVESAVKEELGE